MTETQHLLTILSEECAEVQQRISKALRFGLYEVEPGQSDQNESRIIRELCDLRGVLEMLNARGLLVMDDGILMGPFLRGAVEAKKVKVRKFLDYSRSLGTLTEER